MTTPDDHLLLKFLSGTAGAEERQAVLRWAEASPDNRKMLADLERIHQTYLGLSPSHDYQTAEAWQELENKLDHHKDAAIVTSVSWSRSWVFKVAASVAAFAVCTFLVYRVATRTDVITQTSGEQRMEVALPDGSTVTLNARSRISYHADFEDGRSLTLSGEAFFEVKHDVHHPFVIHAGAAQVRVLGTSFNVRAFETEKQNEVYVVTGKVQLAREGDGLTAVALIPGERGMLRVSDGVILKTADADPNLVAWKSRTLVFRKAALQEVLPTLERYFQITIKLKNAGLGDCRFTSTFEDPDLEEVIEALSVSFKLDVVRRDGQYIFDGDGCGN